MDYSKQFDYKGKCPICDRDMYDDGKSINRHHFVPKSKGGREQSYCHTVCHNKIHSIWTNNELEKDYSDSEIIRENDDIKTFIKWLAKKDPLFYISTKDSKARKGKR